MNLEVSEPELKMAALSSAMAEVLASVACENAVLRTLLVKNGALNEKEWEPALCEFAAQKWQARKNEIETTIQKRAKDIRQKMMSGGSGRKPS